MVKESKASKTTTKKHQIKFKLKPRNEKSRSSSELPLMPVLLSKKQKKETIKLTTTHHVDEGEGEEFLNDLFKSRSPSTSSCSCSKRKPSSSSFSTNDCNSLFLVSPPSLSRSDCTTMTMAKENNGFLSSMENSAKKSFLRRRKRNCLYPHSRKNLSMRCRLPFQRKKQVTPLTNTAVDNKDTLDSASCPTTPPPLHASTIFGFGRFRFREYPYEEDSLSHQPSFICNSSTSSSYSDRILFSPMPTSLSSLAVASAPRKEITTSVMCSSIGSLSLNNNNNNNTQDGTSSKNNNKNDKPQSSSM